MGVKIIQIVVVPETNSYPSGILGLGDNGVTYDYVNGEWVELIQNPSDEA